MRKIVAVQQPGTTSLNSPKVTPWLYYGTGWLECRVIRLTEQQIDYWYSRHSDYTASAQAGFTTNSVYFFPVGVSPTEVGSRLCPAVQMALL